MNATQLREDLRNRLIATGKTPFRVSKETGLCFVTIKSFMEGSREPNVITLNRLKTYLDGLEKGE